MNEAVIKRHIARFLSIKTGKEDIAEIWERLETAGWNTIISIARKNRVMTYFFFKIKQLELKDRLDQETLLIMSREYERGVGRNLVIRRVLKDIIRSLNKRRIKAVILKGAINLCESRYEHWYLRSMEDMDILIKEKDFPTARKCMREAGLCHIGGRIPCDLSEDFEGRGIAVDAHYLPVPEKHINLFDMDSFWSNTMNIDMDGIKTLIPCPTDQIYHMFIHSVIRHQELIHFQIQDLCDFITTCHHYRERIDWGEILRRVREHDIESLFKLYCWQIKRNLGLELPEPINNLSDEDSKYYEKWNNQLSECPEWLESASERLMAILIRGGGIYGHLKNTFNVLIKESVLGESRDLLLSLYHIGGAKHLLPFLRIIHLCRILLLHILMIARLTRQRFNL